MDEKFVPRLFKHFDDFLPTDEEVQGKRVLLLDFVARGYSMKALDGFLRRYLKERHRTMDVRFVALHSGVPPPLPDNTYGIHVKREWLQNAFVSSNFDEFAPRGHFDVRRQEKPKPGTGRYGEMVELLKSRVKNDPAFKEVRLPNRRFPLPPAPSCGDTLRVAPPAVVTPSSDPVR